MLFKIGTNLKLFVRISHTQISLNSGVVVRDASSRLKHHSRAMYNEFMIIRDNYVKQNDGT